MKTRFIPAIVLASSVLLGLSAAAQQIPAVSSLASTIDIERVRTLYGSAAYEEALAAMPVVDGEPVKAEVERYRALCLLALGREQDALGAIERLVVDNPLYLPPPSETSPRMQAMFTTARSKIVPEAARRAYAEARAAYESKNRDVAQTSFTRTIALVDSLPDTAKKNLADLRLLAGEFLALLAPQPAPAPEPTTSVPTRTVKQPSTEVYVPPVAIRESLPSWVPPEGPARRTEYAGLIRILISAEGKVTSATVIKPSHPAYDAATVAAALKWQYKPATRGGQPVPSAKEMKILLLPN